MKRIPLKCFDYGLIYIIKGSAGKEKLRNKFFVFSNEDDFKTRKMNMKRRFKRFFFTHTKSDVKAM